MRDKSLDIFLIVFFGVSGMLILGLAWVWPMPESERIPAAFVGLAGLFIALVRVLLRKSLNTGMEAEQVAVEIEVDGEL